MKDLPYHTWGLGRLEDLLLDVRHALRVLARTPVFALTAIATLALGVGTNTAIFSVVDAALFRPLPYRDADRLVEVWVEANLRGGGTAVIAASGRHAERLRAIRQVFEDVEAYTESRPRAFAAGSDRTPFVGAMTPSFAAFLGVSPQVGRWLTEDDLTAGDVVVISDAYWQRAFNRDPGAIGKELAFVDGTAVVVGVMPPDFRYFAGPQTDAWGAVGEREADHLAGRLRPGISLQQAQREVNRALAEPGSPRLRVVLDVAGWNRARGTFYGAPARPMLLALLGAVAFVMLVACANIANLLLARTLSRREEVAVRVALGATRLQVARHFLVDGVVLASLGSVAAIGLAWAGVRAVRGLMPSTLTDSLFGVSLPVVDLRVLAFALAATGFTGLMTGVFPAWRASRSASERPLTGGRQIAGASRVERRARHAFQAIQVALTLVLLTGAGLLLASFARMATAPRGFEPRNLGYASVSFRPGASRPQNWQGAFSDDLTARIAALPGVRGVAAGATPVAGFSGQTLLLDGTDGAASVAVPLELFPVGSGYFRVAGIRLREGRVFGAADESPSARVAIIDDETARRWWPGATAIGRQFRLFPDTPPLTIVGVVSRVRTINVARQLAQTYVPAAQMGMYGTVLFRTTGNPARVVNAIRAAVREIDPMVTVARAGTVDALFAEFDPLASPRFYSVLLGLFAAIALLTAAVGLYGVLSYSIGRRTREIGVRVALGATSARIRRLALADVLWPVLTGLLAGVTVALWLSRFIASQLFQTAPRDPLAITVAVLVLLVSSVIAALVPLGRATRVNPVDALRAE